MEQAGWEVEVNTALRCQVEGPDAEVVRHPGNCLHLEPGAAGLTQSAWKNVVKLCE